MRSAAGGCACVCRREETRAGTVDAGGGLSCPHFFAGGTALPSFESFRTWGGRGWGLQGTVQGGGRGGGSRSAAPARGEEKRKG